jgi:uncharacterized protein YqeY
VRNTAEWFRARLSEALRLALIGQDRDEVRTIRCVMSAVDNAGAVAPGSTRLPLSTSEVPRRLLGHDDIAAILQAEIDETTAAAEHYERRGDSVQASRLLRSAASIRRWMTLLEQHTVHAGEG